MKELRYQLDPGINYTVLPYVGWRPFFEQIDVNGKTTLEIGGSQGDITANFRDRGAKSLSIDLGFANLEQLDDLVGKELGKAELDIRSAVAIGRARKRFKQDLKENPGTYIAASALNLPFRNNQFDLIFSGQCICPLISTNYFNLEKSLSEMMRVLKVGGIGIIFPYDNREEIFRGLPSAQAHIYNLDKGEKFLRRPEMTVTTYEVTFADPPMRAIDTRRMLIMSKEYLPLR